MRLKLFRAVDTAEALAAIRAELGSDALILSTRRVTGGVEVTAAVQPEDEDEPEFAPVAVRASPVDLARETLLAFHGIHAPLNERLRGGDLAELLARALAFGALPLDAARQPLLFVGPAGAGKTLTVVRLATRLVMQGIRPTVITADGNRAGAIEQLSAYTQLLQLELVVASQPLALARALTRQDLGKPVLIDAPGLDPFDSAQQNEMAALAAATNARVVLVLPAGLDAAEAAELAAAFHQAGATMLVATRLDVARRLGAVLAAAQAGPLTLVEAGVGADAASGLVPLTPAFLAQRLVAAVDRNNRDR